MRKCFINKPSLSIVLKQIGLYKGTSENWNGIVRRFIPKGMELTDLNPDILVRVNRYIDQMPRKRFGYRTPEELFEEKFKDITGQARKLSGTGHSP